MAMIHHSLHRRAVSNDRVAEIVSTPGVEAASALLEIYANRAMLDEAFEWLQEAAERQVILDAVLEYSEFRTAMQHAPFLRPLRADPRRQQGFDDTRGYAAGRYSMNFVLIAPEQPRGGSSDR